MAITIKPTKSLARAVFNDGLLNGVKNAVPTHAAIMGILADSITARQHEGRPFHHWWGGNITASDQPDVASLRMLRINLLEGGCKQPRGIIEAIPGAGLTSTSAGIYAYGELNAFSASSSTQVYPDEAFSVGVQPDTTTDTAVPTGEADEITIGSDSIIMVNGVLYEDTVTGARPDDVVTRTGYVPGGDILADQTSSRSTNEVLVDRFQHVWTNRRPQIGWSCQSPNYCNFNTSSQQFRYWADQTVGDGGTAPSATGPGDTLPVRYAGSGLRATVRVYVWVYARMSGNTNNGTLAIANKDSGGTMQPFVQIGSSGMITTNVWTWYPVTGGAFDPASTPYFESPTGVAFDRVLLGAKSTGATDTVQIADWVMFVYHSVA